MVHSSWMLSSLRNSIRRLRLEAFNDPPRTIGAGVDVDVQPCRVRAELKHVLVLGLDHPAVLIEGEGRLLDAQTGEPIRIETIPYDETASEENEV